LKVAQRARQQGGAARSGLALAEARRHFAAVEAALVGVSLEAEVVGELRSPLDFLVRRRSPDGVLTFDR
jgi:geranylgeranyl diphosphate synthase type I